jgi:predicted hydrocarbon binding protein
VGLRTVRIPEEFIPQFEQAEKIVSGYFDSMIRDPAKGTIIIGGERYVLVRAASLSVHFLKFMKDRYPGLTEQEALEGAGSVLFEMAHSIGKNDARAFCEKLNVSDAIAKLSSGPIHFAYTGWAFVDIFPESNAVPNEEFYFIYDHPQSFEADSWIKLGEPIDFCACFMNAGYSSGWCAESFGLELRAKEIFCRARGDEVCRFIMAPPHRINGYVEQYLKNHPAPKEKR